MQFFSTRDNNRVVSASQAIAQGLSDEGGLFVPQSFPQVDVKAICALDYPEMAAAIVGQYLTDYSQEFLREAAKATYGAAFGGKAGYLAPVSDEVYSLELWHGPTCAFKDYALQLMPKLLVEAKKNLDRTEKTLILVATSGDTGKAALDGYHDIPGVEIAVFFPTGGTSEIQRLQMATQEGDNVAVYAVHGNCCRAGKAEHPPVQRQLHQLGPSGPADRLLFCCVRPASQGGADRAGRRSGFLRPHRQLRRHSGGLLRQADGLARGQTGLRFQREQCFDGFPHHGYLHR